MPNILVVDDDPQVRRFLEMLLLREGYGVTLASDGEKAMKLFRENPADLVITDIVMPEQEGIGLITELRAGFPKVPIIAISGGGRIGPESYLPIARSLGAARVFAKPLEKNLLLEAIRELIPA